MFSIHKVKYHKKETTELLEIYMKGKMAYYTEIYISWVIQWSLFWDTLPDKSSILINMHHLDRKPIVLVYIIYIANGFYCQDYGLRVEYWLNLRKKIG